MSGARPVNELLCTRPESFTNGINRNRLFCHWMEFYSPSHPRISNRNEIQTYHSVGLILIYFAGTTPGNILVTGVFLSMAP